MKRWLLLLVTIAIPASSWAALNLPPMPGIPETADLLKFSSFSETQTLEWGCPVADKVAATSRDEALQKVRSECMEEAQRAAASKPDVMDVIQTKVIWPDINVLELADGYHLSGTFFVETTVVQRTALNAR